VDVASDNAGNDERRTLGATLAQERERQGLSRAEVAQRLHMSPWQIEALERGDYERLPKGTFLRGFVRNYAKLLGLAPDSVLPLLAEGAPPEAAPRIIVPTQNIRFDPLGERFSSPYVKAAALAVVAVAIGFAGMYWAMYVRPSASAARKAEATRAAVAPPRTTAPAPAPTPSEAPQAAPPPAAAVPAATVAPPAPTKSGAASPDTRASSAAAADKAAATKSAAKDAAAATVAAAKPAGSAKMLRFHFVGESWVEVRDSRGKVLFQRLNAAGSDAEVSGRPPLDVVVGNAPEVRMTYDGRDFPLEPHTEVAVARFTLE
jgi:cytoskeleton protein RodZ